MGVQKKILKRTFTQTIKVGDKEVSFTTATGSLVGGIPGKLFSIAYGPVAHAISLPAEAEIGSFVEGHGIIINAPEYALYGGKDAATDRYSTLAPSLVLPKNTQVTCVTAGQIWVKKSEAEKALAKMNGYVVFATSNPPFDPTDSDAGDDDSLCVIEVNSFKAE